MSTLQEIEAAAKMLPRVQQEALLVFLTECLGHFPQSRTPDAFDAVIGAFAGPAEATGRRAEEILYGKSA